MLPFCTVTAQESCMDGASTRRIDSSETPKSDVNNSTSQNFLLCQIVTHLSTKFPGTACFDHVLSEIKNQEVTVKPINFARLFVISQFSCF